MYPVLLSSYLFGWGVGGKWVSGVLDPKTTMVGPHLPFWVSIFFGYVECALICTSCAALNSIDAEEYPLGVEKYTINTKSRDL